MKNKYLQSSKYSTIFFIVLFILLFTPIYVSAQSASLSIFPQTGIFPVGEPFTVDVRIDTGGTVISVTNATISYDPNNVSFVSVSGENSIFPQVIQTVDSVKGEVGLSGIIKYGLEGYSGNDGLVAQVTFLPKRNVATQLYFVSGGAMPLNLGASVADSINILTDLNSANYTFVPKGNIPANVTYAYAQDEFEITPLPIPDDEWFATTSVTLSWSLPTNVSEMKTLVSKNPDDSPTKAYQVPVSSVTIDSLEEGINYFLLQFRFGQEWGTVIQNPIQVDISDPEYVVIKEVERKDDSDPRVSFAIEATDTYSGISRYEIEIDGGEPEKWEKTENDGIYKPGNLTPGEHVLTVRAFDRAGNSTSSDMVFLVKSLEPPVLISESVPDRALVGDTISVRGISYPDADVTVYISHNDNEALEKNVRTNTNGEFFVDITDGAKAGKYTMWFSVTDNRGAVSSNSIKRSVEVTQPLIMLFGLRAVTYLSVIVPLIALIALLFLVLWLGYTWMRGYRKRIRKETGEAYTTTKDEFDSLRKELTKQIGMLERANQSRELTKEEMRIFTDLSKRLDKMERHIEQEIEDIEVVKQQYEKLEETQTKQGAFKRYKEKLQHDGERYENAHTVHLK